MGRFEGNWTVKGIRTRTIVPKGTVADIYIYIYIYIYIEWGRLPPPPQALNDGWNLNKFLGKKRPFLK
jgi:hypothetical protein